MYENVYKNICWFTLGLGGAMTISEYVTGTYTYTFSTFYMNIAFYALALFGTEIYKQYKKSKNAPGKPRAF